MVSAVLIVGGANEDDRDDKSVPRLGYQPDMVLVRAGSIPGLDNLGVDDETRHLDRALPWSPYRGFVGAPAATGAIDNLHSFSGILSPRLRDPDSPEGGLRPEDGFEPPLPADELTLLLQARFAAQWAAAYAVADCETGGKLSAGMDARYVNYAEVGKAGEVSIFQIRDLHGYDRERLRIDLEYAVQAAWELSEGGTTWEKWTCQP